MCGIVGYTGHRRALPILLEALKRLEYRGYDSAGIAILEGGIQLQKDKGEIRHLERELPEMEGTTGFGHTRWATHGAPSRENAHPFLDCQGTIALAHNGIIENHSSLRAELEAKGHKLTSQTDTETVVHMVEDAYEGNLEAALRSVLPQIQGAYAFALMHASEEGKLVVARKDSPLVVGLGTEENLFASDVHALLRETSRILYLMDGELAVITPTDVDVYAPDGSLVKREPEVVSWTVEDSEKGGFAHFMLKEIFEQPGVIHSTLLGRVSDLESDDLLRGGTSHVKLVACGTSFHAALAGKYIMEELAGVPASAELASEYRYTRASGEKPLVVLVTQSGETADTIAAAREARKRGCRTLAITNYLGCTIAREAEDVLYTRAGLEIGVAATKTFTAELMGLYLLALRFGVDTGHLTADEARKWTDELRALPRAVQSVLDSAGEIEKLAREYSNSRSMFFLGRNINYPISLEGALKMKEISYIHAEGYPAGELKHGPLALLTEETPVVALVPRDHTYEKMWGNIGEVSARGSPVIAIAYEGDDEMEKYVDHLLHVPWVKPVYSPVVNVVALQLLAYYTARERGCSIDKPRHLAKSVTVE
ncbi:MAG: glutamine--fructose-6-phosphate transaminase (isomerizing) [Candidatus Thermoplasmatota archaeon]|nr:glutamine--fructose-6-phosphate transaminase (isomerizing) [Candidatus Thermoplasmatota archaeon]